MPHWDGFMPLRSMIRATFLWYRRIYWISPGWKMEFKLQRKLFQQGILSLYFDANIQWKMQMVSIFGIHIPTPGMCQYMFLLLWRGMRALTIYLYINIYIYNSDQKSMQTQSFIANALLNAFDRSVNWRCIATPFKDQSQNSMIYGLEVGITTPKETDSMGHSKSIYFDAYIQWKMHMLLLFWHTHSNSRYVPVHVFSCYDVECGHVPNIHARNQQTRT